MSDPELSNDDQQRGWMVATLSGMSQELRAIRDDNKQFRADLREDNRIRDARISQIAEDVNELKVAMGSGNAVAAAGKYIATGVAGAAAALAAVFGRQAS